MLSLLKSRKFWLAWTGVIAVFLELQLGLEPAQAAILAGSTVGLLASLIGGISLEDMGKKLGEGRGSSVSSSDSD